MKNTIKILGLLALTLLLASTVSAQATCLQLGSLEFCCGDSDGVCPMDYEDSLGQPASCTGASLDPDCCPSKYVVERVCEETIQEPGGSGTFEYTTCKSSSSDAACCPNADDCVYSGVCYSFGTVTDVYSNDGEEECSDEGVWCPEGFDYDLFKELCVSRQDVCYPGPKGLCDYEPYELGWYLDEDCFFPSLLPRTQSCCYDFSIGGTDFYNYQDVEVR